MRLHLQAQRLIAALLACFAALGAEALTPNEAKILAHAALATVEPDARPVAVASFRDADGIVAAHVVELAREKDGAVFNVVVSDRAGEAPIQRLQRGLPWHKDPAFVAALPEGAKSVEKLLWEGTYELYAPERAGLWREVFTGTTVDAQTLASARERRRTARSEAAALGKTAKGLEFAQQWSAARSLLDRQQLAPGEMLLQTATPPYGYTGWVRNVPYLFQGASPDCGIVSMMDILLYHDANGFPGLVDEGNLSGLRTQLRTLFNWTTNGTYAHDQLNGTATYISGRNVGRFTLTMHSKRNYTGVTSTNMAFSQYTAEINANRPAQLMIYNYAQTNPTWPDSFTGGHAIAGVGYYSGTLFGQAASQWAIIHDNWKGSFSNPYDSSVSPPYVDYSLIETMIKVQPPAAPSVTASEVAFVSPTSGSTVASGGSVTVVVQGTPATGRTISSVTFLLDNVTVGTGTATGSNRYEFTTGALAAGSRVIRANLVDSGGGTANASITLTVSATNTPPVVGWYSPQYENAEVAVGVPFQLSASATDADGSINQVYFYEGSTTLGAATAPASGSTVWSRSWTPSTTGTSVLTVRAQDNSGATSELTRTVRVVPLTSVGNDYFATATTIANAGGFSTASNTSASKETSEPNHAGNTGGRSLWWKWTATGSGSVAVNTTGSTFDTVLAVYTGTAVSTLTQVAANDDANGTLQSALTFTSTAGTTYYIAVDGYSGATGTANLTLAVGSTNQTATYAATNLPQSIPDNNTTGRTSTITVPTSGPLVAASVSAAITHTYIGDLQVVLTSPSGTSVTLHNNTGGATSNLTLTAVPLTSLLGETATGVWTLTVKDTVALDTGALTAWSLTLTTATVDNNTYDVAASGLPVTIPDNSASGIEVPFTVSGVTSFATLSVSLGITHSWRGDLRVILVSPAGVSETLHDRTGGSADDLVLTRQPTTRFVGTAPNGTWKLQVLDLALGDTGSLTSATLHFGGASVVTPTSYLGPLMPQESGWQSSAWLGLIYTTSFPWLYHYEHGWLYAQGTGGTAVYLYDVRAGRWYYTSPSLYPRLYNYQTSSWLYYQRSTKNPRRFYDYSSRQWTERQ